MNKNVGYAIALLLALAAPFYGYPVFLMKLLCFALFACAFNLLIGYTGLLSFGHAAFFGGASYITGSKVERIYREVRVNAIGGGSEEIMLDLAGRQLFGGKR